MTLRTVFLKFETRVRGKNSSEEDDEVIYRNNFEG